jgi:aerobic carbon-monoxide dehydrogenase medium subunit
MKDLRQYYRPASAAEAVRIKRDQGARAVYMGGSTDLLVHRPLGVESAIDIRRCGMDYVRDDQGSVAIGGGTSLRDAEAGIGGVGGGMLREAVRETAPWLIRNVATLAGNTANASPAADSVPALLALDTTLRVLGEIEEEVSIGDVLVGPHRTSLGDRLILELRVPAEAVGKRAHFTKLARSASDIALVNLAVALHLEDGTARNVRIALGAVAPTAIRATRAEAALEGQKMSHEVLREVERIVCEEVRPISDWRASEAYRRRMSGVLVRRALAQAAGLDGNGASA